MEKPEYFTIQEARELNEDWLFEMANVRRARTGLPYDLWIDPMGEDRTNTHNEPRVKINVDGTLIPVTISDDPQIPNSVKKKGIQEPRHFTAVQKYIRAYRDILLAHFELKIDDGQAINLLKRLDSAEASRIELSQIINLTPTHITFEWDNDELIFIIKLWRNDEILEELHAFDEYQLFKDMRELQYKYTVDKIIDVHNMYPPKYMNEQLNKV